MDCSLSYHLEEIIEDYFASLFVSVVHVMLGAPSWCFNPKLTSPLTAQRFKVALLDSYQRCGDHFGLEGVERFANYFGEEIPTKEEDCEDSEDEKIGDHEPELMRSAIIAEE